MFTKHLSKTTARLSINITSNVLRSASTKPGKPGCTSYNRTSPSVRNITNLSRVSARGCSTPATSFFTHPAPLRRHNQPGVADRLLLKDVQLDVERRQLVVSWDDGDTQIYPFVWLRDNCRCTKCFHPVALARSTYAHTLDVELLAKTVTKTQDGSALQVNWDDGHVSEFPSKWLREYRFDNTTPDQLLNVKYKPWGADVNLQFFDFNSILEDDQTLYDWLVEMVTVGISIVTKAPKETGQLERIGERVAFLRKSNYGPTFHVKAKMDPSNLAYTTGALALHTDLAYYINEPDIQMLHCIEQVASEGGENVVADGFKVALDLKRDDPEAFHLLSTYPFEFSDIGKDHYGEFLQRSRHPTIKLNELGEIEKVTISDHSRDAMLRSPVHLVLPIYRALNKYCKMLLEPENLLQYKLEEGNILAFNNCRVLHGRNSFRVIKAGGRQLEGGYLDWDEVFSKLHVLSRKLQNQK
ncbi:gamma-butyrobetaine dioxygenase-like [Asterias amurensis]|uniref:gamma-butyrobetaine dioxygenase-like n=1 Tax=Asterias amurensis TaxID=7602 RepID=UPI003AB2666D